MDDKSLIPPAPGEGAGVEEALFDALHTLERLRDLTPMRANEATAQGLHVAIKCIAESALERLTPALTAAEAESKPAGTDGGVA